MVDQVGDRVLVPIHWPVDQKFETRLMPGTIDKIKGTLAFVKLDEGVTYVTNLDKLQTLQVEQVHLEPLKWTDHTDVQVDLS